MHLRLSQAELGDPFADFDAVFTARRQEANEFYDCIQEGFVGADARNVQRQA